MPDQPTTTFDWKTAWGPMAAAAAGSRIVRILMPGPYRPDVGGAMAKRFPRAIRNRQAFEELIGLTDAYFRGHRVNFASIHCDLTACSDFARTVLTACRNVGYAETLTYGELAGRIERPTASRAVAGALAANPLPLVIPCHRIVSASGIGGYSASGGVDLKRRLLDLERGSQRVNESTS